MLQTLQDFGLSEKEARTYLTSLEIGAATADQLAKHSSINRSTTYLQIESLGEKGLMSTYEEGKKTYFIPESPEHLSRILEQKRQKLDVQQKELVNAIPSFMQMFENAGDKPLMRFFYGKEGVITMRKELSKSKGKKLYIFSAYDYLINVFTKKERDKFIAERIAKKIDTKILISKKKGVIESAPLTEVRQIPSELYPLESDIYICGDTIGIACLKGKIGSVLMRNPTCAKSMTSIFLLAWEAAEKHDKQKQ